MAEAFSCPTNLGKTLSPTPCYHDGRSGPASRMRGAPKLPRACAPRRSASPTTRSAPPRPAPRPLCGPVTPTPSDRRRSAVSTIRRRLKCTRRAHSAKHGLLNSGNSKRRSQHTGCPHKHPASFGSESQAQAALGGVMATRAVSAARFRIDILAWGVLDSSLSQISCPRVDSALPCPLGLSGKSARSHERVDASLCAACNRRALRAYLRAANLLQLGTAAGLRLSLISRPNLTATKLAR